MNAPALFAIDVPSKWALDPAIAFLNHGSFGARPRAILATQDRLRAEFEASPIEFLHRTRNSRIDQAKAALGRFLGMSLSNFGFVTNATGGINAVLRSLKFNPGDELLTTNHVYNAVRMTMKFVAQQWKATYIEIDVPLPLRSPQQIVQAIEMAITPHTKLLVIDHISSPTAVIFPLEELIALGERHGVDVLIDGAHAPGMLPLNVEAQDAAYYAGNLHKWLCAPVGAAFLWVRPDKQKGIHPLTISHFLDQGFAAEWYWQATRDITPWLCVPEAIAFFDDLGPDRVQKHNHDLAVWVQQMLCEKWSVEPATPLDGSMIGSMATVQLPAQDRLKARFGDIEAMNRALYHQHRIEVPVVDWGNRWWVRPCCHVYNRAEQYDRLAEAVLRVGA
jgi:isopenicillin-N epimerase